MGLTKTLTALANAIRSKIGYASYMKLSLDQMEKEIASLNRRGVLASVINGSITELKSEDFEGVKEIRPYALANANKLKSVTIPDHVSYVAPYSFFACSALENVMIGDGVIALDRCSFQNCSALVSLTMLKKRPPTIQNETFSRAPLDEIIVPLRWEDLFKSATNWSVWADYIEGDASIVTYVTADELSALGISTVAASMFENFTNLESAEIPDSITLIDNYAFKGCVSLKKVTLPERMTNNIGKLAFYGCRSLEEIILPKGMANIRGSCFYGCRSLRKVVIPESIAEITGHAFNKCESLTELTIPSGVASIKESALKIGTTTNKATITMLPVAPPAIQSNSFEELWLKKIIVPKGSGEAYKKATNWSAFADYIEEETL